MERSRKAKILMSFVFVILISVASIIASRGSSEAEMEEKVVMGIEDFDGVPNITSVAPLSATVGEEYVYDVKIVDSDDDAFVLELTDRPNWLYIDDNNFVRGLPDKVGSYKFVLRVSDGENYSFQENYILVEDNE
jgi:hypothetical protein